MGDGVLVWSGLRGGPAVIERRKRACLCVPTPSPSSSWVVARLSVLARSVSLILSQDGCSKPPWLDGHGSVSRLTPKGQRRDGKGGAADASLCPSTAGLLSVYQISPSASPKPPCFFVLHPGPAHTSRKLDSILQGRAAGPLIFAFPSSPANLPQDAASAAALLTYSYRRHQRRAPDALGWAGLLLRRDGARPPKEIAIPSRACGG